MERKTPRRAGCSPPYGPTPLGGGRWYGWVMFRLPDKLASASVPCKLVCGPLAASLLLTHCGCDLKAFFQGCTLFRFNEKGFRNTSLQVRTLRRKRKRSGKRPAHQAGRRMQSQVCLAPRTVCGCSLDAVCRGGSLGRGPRPKRRLSSPILSSLVKKESGPRRALINLSGRHWLVEICKFF